MSYLLLPVLFEHGLFTEARGQLRKILRFHANVRRDTADMIARALRYHNYMKSLELQAFIGKCESSTTSLVANPEAAWVEVIDNPEFTSNLTSLGQFLERYSSGDLPAGEPCGGLPERA